MRKITVERGRTQMGIWCVRIACWISEATNTHSEYVTFISCPLQQRVPEQAPVLRCRYRLSPHDISKEPGNTDSQSHL